MERKFVVAYMLTFVIPISLCAVQYGLPTSLTLYSICLTLFPVLRVLMKRRNARSRNEKGNFNFLNNKATNNEKQIEEEIKKKERKRGSQWLFERD